MLDLTLTQKDGAREVRDDFTRITYDHILPYLDEVFSGIADANTVIRLDRLELDLGVLSLEKLEEQILEKLMDILPDLVKEKVRGLGKAGPDEEGIVLSADNELSVLLYFLKTGILPWAASSTERAPFQVLYSRVLEAQPEVLKAALFREQGATHFVRRLALQLSGEQAVQTLKLLAGLHAGFALKLKAGIVALAGLKWPEATSSRWFMALLDAILFREVLKSPHVPVNPARVVPAMLAIIPDYFSVPESSAYPALLSHLALAPEVIRQAVIPPIPALLEKQVERLRDAGLFRPQVEVEDQDPISRDPEVSRENEETHAGTSDPVDSGTVAKPDLEEPGPVKRSKAGSKGDAGLDTQTETAGPTAEGEAEVSKPEAGQAEAAPNSDSKTVSQVDANADQPTPKRPPRKKPVSRRLGHSLHTEYYVDNAGIILLWPFMKPVFSGLDYLEGKSFKDEMSRERAALLLQHAASGNTVLPEHDLLLNKLLVGLDVEHPLPAEPDYSDLELQASENLIRSTITYWKALREMTNDGFRGSFMHREGILQFKGQFWELRVEQKAFDILMNQLPWGIRTVMLPWLDYSFMVEW